MKLLRIYLIALFALYFLIIIHFVINLPIWSPIDEIGHYDYIDQISAGRFPSPGERISDYTAEITIQRFEWIIPATFQGTKETMGQAGYSYEAQQPPIYYMLLAIPNAVMKGLGIDPQSQVQVLRIINALFEILGAAAGGLVVYQLRKIIKFSSLWILVIPVLLIIPNWSWRSSLGNGNLSLLLINLALFFVIGSLLDPSRSRNAAFAVLFGSLAFLTKYTNALALAIILLLLVLREVYWARKTKNGYPINRFLTIGWPLILIVLYLGTNMLRFGINDPLGSQAVEQLFAENTILVWGFEFFKLLFSTSYRVNFLPFSLPVLPLFFIGAAATLIRLLLCFYKNELFSGLAWVVTLGIVFGVAVFAWGMTKIAPTVDWGFFRHFSGYLLPFVLVSIGFLMYPGKYERVFLVLLSSMLCIPAAFYIINTIL